jgi:hypothetical protein
VLATIATTEIHEIMFIACLLPLENKYLLEMKLATFIRANYFQAFTIKPVPVG